jgi:hypothetical protein
MADRVRLGGKGAALLTLALLCHSGVPRDWRLACHAEYGLGFLTSTTWDGKQSGNW